MSRRVERWRRQVVQELQSPPRSPRSRPCPASGATAAVVGDSGLLAAANVGCGTVVNERLAGAAVAALPSWDFVRTVTPPEVHTRELERRRTSNGFSGASDRHAQRAARWVLAIAVGVCTSLTGCFIEYGVRICSSFRSGYCSQNWLASEVSCASGSWIAWGDGFTGFLLSLFPGVAMACVSALLVFTFAPAAAGSGIPEAKTILNGFVLPEVVARRTLCVKVVGLVLSVSAGMALGKEGPLVHVALCWADLLSGFVPEYRIEAFRREMFSAAAAAGVSTAFGAPLGGVLFSLEEVSSHFPARTLLRAFTAAVAAAVVLEVVNLNGTGGLTLYSVEYRLNPRRSELIAFVLLGVAGGLVGACFNAVNVRWSRLRMSAAFRKRIHPVVEVSVIAVITLVSSWPLQLTRPLSSTAIHAMFGSCEIGPYHNLKMRLGLCTEAGDYAAADAGLIFSLAAASAVRFWQMTLTFGTACPAGLFVPSLFTGACLGRCVGTVMRALSQDVEPGLYSMVGAAAVLGGVCRVTISLVVIMLELTGGLTYVVPFMLSVLVAKLVGDMMNDGIYDLYVVLKGYPFLKEELNVTFSERCCDIMESRLTKIDVSHRLDSGELRHTLRNCTFRGFPVVDGVHFVGYLRRPALEEILVVAEREEAATQEAPELSSAVLGAVDRGVMCMVPDAPLSQAHSVFKQTGCKHIFVVGSSGARTRDELVGIVSKKAFIRFLNSGVVGHMLEPSRSVLISAGAGGGGNPPSPTDSVILDDDHGHTLSALPFNSQRANAAEDRQAQP
eukprot:TRINITY_DN14360_c0_g2_i1.p1 TRINITY_DN14360_c0_g2~~TRINITY_DN14360_c0_g2_i1.p1  ORF type:complete len:825 (+),score=167.66 TRINITY_DN14360_c0_g2_i1:124-2475(+)